jgi:hypothetical protein
MGNLGKRLAAPLLVIMLTASAAAADERRSAALVISRQAIQQTLSTPPRSFKALRQRATSSNHTGRRVLWTALGATGGFFAGGYAGAAIENAITPCHCDDPGFKGALIGLPVGAIAGGVAGWVLGK